MDNRDNRDNRDNSSTQKQNRREWRYPVVIAISLLICALALAWALFDSRQVRAAPDFSFTTFDGVVYRMQDLRGKVVVLNFWASWCGPCRAEAPALQQTWLDLRNRDVVFLGVDQADTLEAAQSYLREYAISYPNGPDNGIVLAFQVQSLPTTIIVGRDGTIRDTLWTAVEPGDLRARIEAALR